MIRTSLAAAAIAAASFGAHADLFNQNVTSNVIMGSGVGNGSWTVDRDAGIELGLRGKQRFPAANTYNSNGLGGYSFAAGQVAGQQAGTGIWSIEWSINSNFDDNDGLGGNLNAYSYLLGIDTNSSLSTSYITYDPINGINGKNGVVLWDHSFGNNSTAQSGGAEISDTNTAQNLADYASAIASNNLAQNSWRAVWVIPGFDPTVDGVYNFFLSASDQSGEVARTDIQIIVGAGSNQYIPEPASLALVGVALAGLAIARRRKQST